MTSKVLLGVDPGRSKTGLALVEPNGRIIDYTVALMKNFDSDFHEFIRDYEIERCVMGNGTTSETMQGTLEIMLPGVPVTVVDEAHSTEEARELYWEINPPKGLRKLFPTGMQVPPENLDGLAAVVLVKRYIQGAAAQH